MTLRVATLALAVATQALPSPIRKIAQGSSSHVAERLELVVRSERAWRSLWLRLEPDTAPPVVDFNREMVAVVLLWPRHSKGHRVEIFAVAKEGRTLVVQYRESQSERGARQDDVSTAPYHVVAIPQQSGPVRFVEVRELGPPSR